MIKHILADGTELKSIEGRTIPPTGKTEAVYKLIAGFFDKPEAQHGSRTAGKPGVRGQRSQVDKEG